MVDLALLTRLGSLLLLELLVEVVPSNGAGHVVAVPRSGKIKSVRRSAGKVEAIFGCIVIRLCEVGAGSSRTSTGCRRPCRDLDVELAKLSKKIGRTYAHTAGNGQVSDEASSKHLEEPQC